jgi:hypothetical protein
MRIVSDQSAGRPEFGLGSVQTANSQGTLLPILEHYPVNLGGGVAEQVFRVGSRARLHGLRQPRS